MLTGNNVLENIYFPKNQKTPKDNWVHSEKEFSSVLGQLDAYFKGTLKIFEKIEMHIIGTDFQKKVWNELLKIPYGETISYGELATRIGNPKASRAVGMANSKNPIPIIIPCHRVIGKNGSLTGFGGGIDVKKQLLTLEKTDNI